MLSKKYLLYANVHLGVLLYTMLSEKYKSINI